MIKWNKKFEYPKTIREAIEGQRHYIINEEKLPSVTTILQATQSEEKKASLQNWMKRVGSDNAEHIKNTAANRGSIMSRRRRRRSRTCSTIWPARKTAR